MAGTPGAAGAHSGYPQWFVDQTTWVVGKVIDAAEKYVAETTDYPDRLIFFTSQQAAENYSHAHHGGSNVNTPSTGQPNNPLSGLAAIGDFFSRLTQASTWIRVAEVLLGAGLIIVGLAKLASGTPVGKAAVKAGKAAAIL